MEEADLLKERLQAITDKRRVQEDIAKKRRQIEEEKLKLQYIKKKALREQWLMDGLSQQTEEEQEAMRLQAQDEQQQSADLRSNIDRIEKEVETLETQELNISANEEVILKRLKEVERTAEDIIKKATTGAEETGGKKLNEGCSSPKNHNVNGSSSFTDAITMETTEQTESATTTDCEGELAGADSLEQERDLSADDEQLCLETDSSDSSGEKATLDVVADLPTGSIDVDGVDGVRDSPCTNAPCMDQREALILESGHEELNRNESINSSVSDTLSSADSVYENEAHRKRQDTPPECQDLEPESEPENNESNPEDDGYRKLVMERDEDPEVHEISFEPPIRDIKEESILEQYIREEAMSDVSNESCHDLDPDDMDECLRVEIAAASSDSDTDEKWRTIFSSSINKEDDDSYLDSLQLSAQELFVQKVEIRDLEEQDDNTEEAPLEVPQEEEVLEQPDDIISFPDPPQEVMYNPLALQGLSKISEDENENGKDANYNHQHSQHLNSDPTKKLPKDFCVIQETKSENVSTEHVDFQVARKQWLDMEEQTKNQIVSPTTKQPSFHGSHSFMYTPVRNVERPHKRDQDLENLNLVGDYPHTQFSPCSEDSGLDDSSYRSPYDDPETPVEKEMRIAIEREENFRKERGFSKMGKSTDCAPSRTIPRSTSTPLTPSFIITSSPSKGPLNYDVSANNVIILEPSDDFPSSPRRGKDAATARPGEWRSDDGNLIILETSNLIIRSASEFCLNKACEQPQEKMFLNNPFFKLRSRSTMSLVDEEIKMVKQREEELRKERANLYGKDRFNTEMMLPNHMDTLAFDNSVDVPEKCKSSPTSPMKTAYRMDRSALSCDHRFPEVYTGGRRKSAMALRWEAGEFTKDN